MEERVKERLIGASVLVSLAVVFVAMLIGPTRPNEPRSEVAPVSPPSRPGARPRAVMPISDEGRARTEDEGGAAGVTGRDRAAGTGAAARVAAPIAVPIHAPTDRSTGSTDRSTRHGAWVVQLGSFARAENANALRDRLRAGGYSAFTEPVHARAAGVTRVYVGPELERAAARESMRLLERETGLEGIVVRDPGG